MEIERPTSYTAEERRIMQNALVDFVNKHDGQFGRDAEVIVAKKLLNNWNRR